jgi:hypothetical protein
MIDAEFIMNEDSAVISVEIQTVDITSDILAMLSDVL